MYKCTQNVQMYTKCINVHKMYKCTQNAQREKMTFLVALINSFYT